MSDIRDWLKEKDYIGNVESVLYPGTGHTRALQDLEDELATAWRVKDIETTSLIYLKIGKIKQDLKEELERYSYDND